MNTPLLEVRALHKHFAAGPAAWFQPQPVVRALDGVSLQLQRGEVLALVGESGCGKSTLALTITGLEAATHGTILFAGEEMQRSNKARLRALRRQMQMIFQDPYESLNPLMRVAEIVEEPLLVHSIEPAPAARRARVLRALEDAGLKPAQEFAARLPHELSGGQRQRVVIASALVLQPALLLADEPVSMLDVSIRAEILNLLAALRAQHGIAVLFITHDLSSAAALADRVAVMYLGRIVELGPAAQVLHNPLHPYTRALQAAVPVANPRQRHRRLVLQGETPNPAQIPSGCRFHPRCPLAEAQCKANDPQLHMVAAGHSAACLLLEQK